MSDNEEKIKSRELLKPKFRTKYQTTDFIYKALDVAEQQIEELLKKIERLEGGETKELVNDLIERIKNIEFKTLEDVVKDVFHNFEGIEELAEFKKGEDYFASFCHSQLSGGIGMQIRNQYNLWDESSKLHKHFKEVHECEHPDEMSDLIIRSVYRKKIDKK